MKIGRIDLAHSLKQYFELAGQMHPELGEGIVPTAQLVDLERTPFSLDVPFVGRATSISVVGEYSYVVIRPTGLPVNSWATIDRLMVLAPAATGIAIEPYVLTAVPALTTGGTVKPMRRANLDALGTGLPEVDFLYGSSATAPTATGETYTHDVVASRDIWGRWGLSAGGALVIAGSNTNSGITVSVRGRIHFTSAR